MGITDRWVRTLWVRMEEEGDEGVEHRLRGPPSNRRIDEAIQAKAVRYRKPPEWHDFGPRFASEQLAKRHQIEVSRETTRGWMIEAGLWKSHPRKLKEVHIGRPRRSCYGEWVRGHLRSRLAGRGRDGCATWCG